MSIDTGSAAVRRDTLEIDPADVRDLSPLALDGDGRLRVLPAAFWAATTMPERALFGHTHAIYGFPTVELVEHLKAKIGGRRAIEIGSGNGVLAQALGIPATDNLMQEWPVYRLALARACQPTIAYGPNVERLDAHEAVRHYQPDVVLACWVTHRFDPAHPAVGGNEIGPDEAAIVAGREYLFVGNEHVHRGKPIWDLPHTIEYPDFVYSRAHNGSPDFVATWAGPA